MSKEQKRKINGGSRLGLFVFIAVIAVGALGKIESSDFPRTKNSIISLVKTFPRKETGFGQTQARTTKTLPDDQSKVRQLISWEKRLFWDYLELSSRLAVPLVLLGFGSQFQQREKKRTEQQAKLSREIAQDKLAEEAIQIYLDSMANLWLEQKQREELFDDAQLNSLAQGQLVGKLAGLKTITILRRLEGDRERQARIIHFLQDAELDKFIWPNANLLGVNLSGANLSGANLSGANLSGANLSGANLSGANLWGTNLERASLERAELRGAKLESAYLGQADLKGANLERVKLSKANLEETNLRGANLTKVENLNPKQLKLARCWSQAVYQENEQENQRYIEDLKKAQSLDPWIPVDFELWEDWH